MDSFVAIVTDLAAALDVELQEGRAAVELPSRVVEAFLCPHAVADSPVEPRGATVPVSATSPNRVQEAPPGTAATPQAAAKNMDDSADLATVASRVAGCTRCDLHATRTNTVPGAGHPRPEVMFIGEAPGADEDAQGLPFVGRAGQLLTKMIEAMGYSREEVFIANILKCRPPGNRQPTPQEMDVCVPFLRRQIALVQPKVLVALGATATQGLLHTDSRISQLRGRWTSFEGIPLMPTFHPSYLLRMPAAKRDAWADLQLVLKQLGRTPPPRTTSAKDPA